MMKEAAREVPGPYRLGAGHGDRAARHPVREERATRELPRVGVDPLRRHRDANVAEEADRDVAGLASAELASGLPAVTVQQDGLDDLIAYRVHRTEGGHRFLRDQGDLTAADVAHVGPAWGQAGEVDRTAAVAATEVDL